MKSQNPQKLYDKNPVVYIQPTELIKNQFSCSLLIAHSQGHLDRKILKPQWDLIASRKKSLQLADQATHLINHPTWSSTRFICLFMKTTGFSQTSYYDLGFRSKVSEVRRSLKSEGRKRLLQGHKKAETKVFAGC